MESNQIITRQFIITMDEQEAGCIAEFLDGLQDSDYEQPFKRNRVEAEQRQHEIMAAVAKLKVALRPAPVAHSAADTQRS